MRKHRPNRNRLGGSKRNTRGTGRCSIWRRGTCIVESSCDDARRRRDQAVSFVGGSGAGADPYKDATQLFFIVDNGSSHRGQASVERMHRRDKRIVLVHTPIHASWLNQVEIYFSIIQRKVLTPNDFAKLEAIRVLLCVIRGVEQPHTETVRMEIYSTRHAELAKTCVAAFSGSFCCAEKGTGQPRRYL